MLALSEMLSLLVVRCLCNSFIVYLVLYLLVFLVIRVVSLFGDNKKSTFVDKP